MKDKASPTTMIEGGTPTVYVSNMDRAVEFYDALEATVKAIEAVDGDGK